MELIKVEDISELLADLLMVDEERNPIFDDELVCQFMINKVAKLPTINLDEVIERLKVDLPQHSKYKCKHCNGWQVFGVAQGLNQSLDTLKKELG